MARCDEVGSDVLDGRVLGDLGVGRAQVTDGQLMHVVVARQSGEVLEFLGADPQETGHPLRGRVDLEAGPQFGVLRGSSDGARAPCAHPVLLTGGRHHRGRANPFRLFCGGQVFSARIDCRCG